MKRIDCYSLGVDVDSKNLECVLMRKDIQGDLAVAASRRFSNGKEGFGRLMQWLSAKCKDSGASLHITLEASGVYHESLCYALNRKGYELSVVLPNKAKHYMRSLGLKSKNDKTDARGLAHMGAQQSLPVWTPASPIMLELRALLRYRESQQETLTQTKSELHAIEHSANPNKFVVRKLKQTVKRIKALIAQIDEELTNCLAKDPELERKVQMIADSIPGVAILTVATVVAETGGFKLFTSAKQLTSYAGYDVIENQSGNRIGKTKMSKQGNSHIRRILHMPALNVVRFKVGNFKGIFMRILKSTGVKMKAYVAIQRKLLCLIYTLWKNDQPFDPVYHIEATTPEKMVAPI